jgi:hypothetical protein
MARNPAMTQHDDASYSQTNVSTQLSSLNISFNALEKLLEYDIASKPPGSGSFSHEEVSSLIRESEKESRECDREIESLERKIERLKSVILALENRKEKLDSLSKQFRAVLCPSPIQKLPAELLSEIFKLVFPLTHPYPCVVDTEYSSHIEPLVLARTCSHWRSVIYDTPSLWSGIQITLSSVRDDDDPNMIACDRAVAFILERSKDHPLSLTIDRNDENLYDNNDQPLPRTMDRLVRESWRWHSVRLWLCDAFYAFRFWGLTLDLPNLSSFALKVHHSVREEIHLCLMAFRNAPLLRIFNLEGEIDDSIHVVLPWHQLEAIECSSCQGSMARLISSCPRLKSVHVTHYSDYGVTSPVHVPLTTSIDTLILSWASGFEFCSRLERCLRQFQFNALRSLDIYSEPGRVTSHFESFIKLLSQYKSLTSLRLRNVGFSNKNPSGTGFKDEGTLRLVQALASLESLEIIEQCSKGDKNILRDSFVQALIVSAVGERRGQQGTPALPVLQRLTLETQGRYITDRFLVDLVRSRWKPFASDPGGDLLVNPDSVTSLSCVRFVLTRRRCDARVFQPLVDMAADGLKVTVIDFFGRVV